jgi:hypothetical protein
MTDSQDTLRNLSQTEFFTRYLQLKESDWQAMPRMEIEAWRAEVNRRGLGQSLMDQIGEVTLPSSRWLEQRSRPGEPCEASTANGGLSITPEAVQAAEQLSRLALRSTEESSGAPTDAGSGYEIVAYRRLPLRAKRDAFIAEGFLYVRNDVLKEWVSHFILGKCCHSQRSGFSYHSTGCWIDGNR